MFSRTLSLVAVLSLAAPALADVIVVNCSGSGCPGALAGAIGSAQDGDVVLVRSPMSTTTEIVVDGKGITIVAETDGSLWQGRFTIRNVPAGSTAVVSGFLMATTGSIVLEQNAGAVRIQDCTMVPLGQVFSSPPGMVCTSCADVALLRTYVRGESGGTSPQPSSGSVAIQATGSTLAIHDSSAYGGRGRNGYIDGGVVSGGPGSAAIAMSGGSLVLQSARIQGGAGGDGTGGGAGGPGGAGLVLSAGATARAIGGRTLGGPGGIGTSAGAHGVPVVLDGGSWSRVDGPSRAFAAPRIAHAGQPLVLELSGSAGERAVVAASAGAAYADSPALDGVLLLRPPMRRFATGIVGADGTVTLTQTTPGVPGGAPNGLLHLQPVFVDAVGALHLGCAQVVVHLPAAP